MRTGARVAGRVLAALAGALLAGIAILWAHGVTTSGTAASGPSNRPSESDTSGSEPQPEEVPVAGSRSPRPATTGPQVLLAWSQGLPPDAETRLEAIPGVSDATTVRAGLDWIVNSKDADGGVVDRPPDGYAIPMEVAVVEPAEYARFVPPGERSAILALRRGNMLLSDTSTELRRGGTGLRLRMRDRVSTVSGVLSDIAANGYEGIMSGATPPAWQGVETFVLAHIKHHARKRVSRAVRSMLPAGQVARIRVEGETPFLRYGDAVLPQLLVKKNFGEFSAQPQSDGTLRIDPRWVRENIRSERVPVLGEITCHRNVFPQMRRALGEARATGAAYAINKDQFGGCFGPRFISRDPTGRISHHAWGIAFDLNVAENPVGSKPNLNQGLVQVIEKWGFTWGGRWLIPDGMHFEWKRFN
ncbi:MAG: M15 family metallopeptidase [Actinomycetota bacterium]